MTTAPNTESLKRVAIYARYSTDLQNDRSIRTSSSFAPRMLARRAGR
jgi:hypothetical protein